MSDGQSAAFEKAWTRAPVPHFFSNVACPLISDHALDGLREARQQPGQPHRDTIEAPRTNSQPVALALNTPPRAL
jgi:hypothetical protein